LQTSPISTIVAHRPVIIASGKMGIVYELNARTGALLWKTPVGVHNGHDNDSLNLLLHKGTLKLPFTYEPGSLGGVLTNLAVAGNSVYVDTIDLALRYTSTSSSRRRSAQTRQRNGRSGVAQSHDRQGPVG
jgi:alcohol dehydrogenase (cytochrome c)